MERTGARAPGAAVGWTIVVALLLLIPASQLGLNPVGDKPEETTGITTSGSAIERIVTTPSSAPLSVDAAESDSSTSSSAADEFAAPDETLAGPTVPAPSVSSTTDPSTAGPSTTQSAPSTTTPSPSTTAVPTTTTSAAPTAPSTSSSPTTQSTTTGPTTTSPATTTASTTLVTTDTTSAPTTTQARNPNFAVSDSYQLASGKKGKFKVLHNDGNQGQLDQRTLEIIAAPGHAEDYRVRGNHIDYEPRDDYEGTDSLRYRICTLDGVCSVATVTIQVIGA